MNDSKTISMLQRLPVILAVTAASYGLQLPAAAATTQRAAGSKGTHQVQPAQARVTGSVAA